MKRAAFMIFVAGLAGGCVTTPPPKQSHIEASSAIRAAQEVVESDKMPDAELYLARARDHVRIGERMLEQHDYSAAEMHFERAEAEAETAVFLARARVAEDQAKQAEARLNDPEVQSNVDAD